MTSIDAISIATLLAGAEPEADGFLRRAVNEVDWSRLAQGCAEGLHDLGSIWFDGDAVCMALIDRNGARPAIIALACPEGSYPSVGQVHPPALRLERTIRDLHGVEPVGLPDQRPWLDHGKWPSPPAGRVRPKADQPEPYPFLTAEGEGLHQIPVGPVHAGTIEPGHFRFTANGETVVRLEERFGYAHKGIGALCAGATIERAARIMGRVSGDSTVAYAFAFARAVEAALGVEVPERATIFRGVMAELERISHHISDIGAICNDASYVAIHAHCSLLRENILQFSNRAFGHRMMMDCVVPGGVSVDLADSAADELRQVLQDLEAELETVAGVYDSAPSVQDRTVTTGVVTAELARQFAAGGYIGRASGRAFDARRDLAYAPYNGLDFRIPGRMEGDVNARVWLRIEEIGESAGIIRQLLARLAPGALRVDITKAGPRDGAAMVEAFRGDVFVWVGLDDAGQIAHCHVRDASWFQWPLLEAAIEGNIVADFPLCNKSFNCSYSGHDI